MSKLINNTQGFTIVTQKITKDQRLGIKERGLLLTLLSLPNDWDFSVLGLTKIIPDGKATIRSAILKLEEFGYLVRRQAKSDDGKFCGYDWEIIAEPSEFLPFSENRSTGKRTTGNRSTENQPQLNNNKSNTKSSSMYQSIYQEPPQSSMFDGLIDIETIKEVKEQIQYDTLVKDNDIDLVDAVVSCIAELSNTTQEHVFNGHKYSAELIKERAIKTDRLHIEYVLECFNKQQKPIKNIKSYLMTAVFNAHDTMGAYYANAVNAAR